jgi:hypothetical protein
MPIKVGAHEAQRTCSPAYGSVELRPMMIAILWRTISSAHQWMALRKHKGMGGPAYGSVELRPMMIPLLRPKISSAHRGWRSGSTKGWVVRHICRWSGIWMPWVNAMDGGNSEADDNECPSRDGALEAQRGGWSDIRKR